MSQHKQNERREALKIIGAIGSTCAFPFAADELYGQHAHQTDASPASLPAKPVFFSPPEYETICRLADLIVPRTDTPGALDAGVPAYIDYVVSKNAAAQKLYRNGLAWLDDHAKKLHGRRFLELTEEKQIATLRPLCDAADQLAAAEAGASAKPNGRKRAPLGVKFFRAVKGMTSDGYFTSREGLIDTLGYRGNTVMAEFPACIHEH